MALFTNDNACELFKTMKELISNAEDYHNKRSEDIAIIINRNLQILSSTSETKIFDPNSCLAGNFFVSLHDLMSNMGNRASFAWGCVDLLKNICHNSAARYALIHTYQFVPCLAQLVGDQITQDKKIRVLRVIQDLSCGMRIQWQIPHLTHLIVTLYKWIESEQEEEIVTLSLGVLVNLCYKNLPAIYTLMGNVDVKKLIRVSSALEGPIVEVHTCKLLIILDSINCAIPKSNLIKLVFITFKSIVEGLKNQDAILLKQVIEFFQDVAHNNNLKDYDNYNREINTVLNALDNNQLMEIDDLDFKNRDAKCRAAIFDFFNTLIEMKLPLNQFYSKFIDLALKYVNCEQISTKALQILTTICYNVEFSNDNDIFEQFIIGLPSLFILIKQYDDDVWTHIEFNRKIAGLMQLFRTLIRINSVRVEMLKELKIEMISIIFEPLLDQENSPELKSNEERIHSIDAINLYVYTIALINELAKYDVQWINIQNHLMQQRQIHIVLARAVLYGPKDVKCLIFDLSQHFPNKLIAEVMCNLSSRKVFLQSKETTSERINYDLSYPRLSIAQLSHIDDILNRAKNEISSIHTSNIIELYECRLSSIRHSEQIAHANVERASKHTVHLDHKIAQLTAELDRSHQLLFHMQYGYEQILQSKCSVMKEIDRLKDDLVEENRKQKCLEEHNAKLKGLVNKLEENSTRLERVLQKKDDLIKKANSTNENMNLQVKELEANLLQKDVQIQSITDQLKDCSRELQAKTELIESVTRLMAVQTSQK